MTSRVSHASPALLYSVTPDRMWEDDTKLPRHARHHGCKDVASQLSDRVGANIDVSTQEGGGGVLHAAQ